MFTWASGTTPPLVSATRTSSTAVRDWAAGRAAISPEHANVMATAAHHAKPWGAQTFMYRISLSSDQCTAPRSLTRGFVAAKCGSLFVIMLRRTDDLRITQVRPLIPPAILLEEIPLGERASNVISNTRLAVAEAIKGLEPRLVIIAGPCSIHDTAAAL